MTVEFHARGSRGEIWLYEQVGQSFWGEGISAKQFQKELTALGKVTTINVRINSPGGDVFEGFAIYNQLQQHPAKIEVDVDGLAASIASIIAMAADPGHLRIARNAMLMIHNPQGGSYGDERELLRVANLLKTVKGNLADTYVARSANKRADVEAWMDDETWFTAEDAVAHGFADAVSTEQAVMACFDPQHFRNAPMALKRALANAVPQPELAIRRQRLAAMRDRRTALGA